MPEDLMDRETGWYYDEEFDVMVPDLGYMIPKGEPTNDVRDEDTRAGITESEWRT